MSSIDWIWSESTVRPILAISDFDPSRTSVASFWRSVTISSTVIEPTIERRCRGRRPPGTARCPAGACRQRSSSRCQGRELDIRTWWCSSNGIVGKGIQRVYPRADVDRPRAAVVDDQHRRAPRNRLGGPGDERLRPAADFDHDLPGTGGTAGGNDENTNGAAQGFIPGHRTLLTMPAFGHHTLSPAGLAAVIRRAARARRPAGPGPPRRRTAWPPRTPCVPLKQGPAATPDQAGQGAAS